MTRKERKSTTKNTKIFRAPSSRLFFGACFLAIAHGLIETAAAFGVRAFGEISP
jgi:phosphate/sulfate permease